MKWTLIIGIFAALSIAAGAIDLYVDQSTVDAYNFSTFTPETLLCGVLGNDPYIYIVENSFYTYYTCMTIEPFNDTHYHLFDGIYNTDVPIRNVMWVWNYTNHNMTTTQEWYWNSTAYQFEEQFTILLDTYKSYQTPNSSFYEGWEGGQLW